MDSRKQSRVLGGRSSVVSHYVGGGAGGRGISAASLFTVVWACRGLRVVLA